MTPSSKYCYQLKSIGGKDCSAKITKINRKKPKADMVFKLHEGQQQIAARVDRIQHTNKSKKAEKSSCRVCSELKSNSCQNCCFIKITNG